MPSKECSLCGGTVSHKNKKNGAICGNCRVKYVKCHTEGCTSNRAYLKADKVFCGGCGKRLRKTPVPAPKPEEAGAKADVELAVAVKNPMPEAPKPKIKKVFSGVRRTYALRRKEAKRPMVERRRKRQKESLSLLKRSVTKPSSGHPSPRPNRHASKRVKQEVNVNAK